jgi:uncharacterized protein YkwD
VASARIATRLAAAALLCASSALLGAPVSSFATRPASGAAHTSAPVAHAASACPNASLTPRPENIAAVREAILCLINQERAAHGEGALALNARLARAAQGHSEDMASADYFSHYAPGGSSPLDRIRASGYIPGSRVGYEVGENIAWGTLWLATPRSIVAAWMASPGHRANILDARYRETGVGVSPHPPAALADGQAGALYTQDFGTIIPAGHAASHRQVRGAAPHRSSSARSGRITSAARNSERSHSHHGSTRRQVRHRHRKRTRHRARHRRAARRAGRAGAHQRSRRRHRRAGR